MTPLDLFPSYSYADDAISFDKADIALTNGFDGATLVYRLIQRLYEVQPMPIVKALPRGIGNDAIRQVYTLSIPLAVKVIGVIPEPIAVNPSNTFNQQQLTNNLQLTN